jgi:hypothetical protein
LFEDLEAFVFELDSAEADALQFAQDADDFAGFATLKFSKALRHILR